MSLSYKVRRVGDITILDLSGRVTLGSAGEPSLHDIVRNTLQNGGRKILVNLRDVNYIDSNGLGELVSSFTTARRHGGDLRVFGPNLRISGLLTQTRLSSVLDVKHNEPAALFAMATGTTAA